MLEKLYRAFVLFGFLSCIKRPEIPALAGLGVDLPGVEPVLPGLELAYHPRISE
jgi:hypothetical protein